MSTNFENNYKDIAQTKLWSIFKKECNDDDFIGAVGKVCEFGIIKSKDIMRFFPNFTLHDEIHIKNVCNWMTALLGDRLEELTEYDAAMLLISACCHDIGMSVSVEQEKKLKEKHISDEKQRGYIRIHHHERVGEHITLEIWNNNLDKEKHLQRNGITRKNLLALCKSHGEKLDDLKVPGGLKYDLRLCAILLRLADILDFDSSRAPQSLFEHMGLDEPKNIEQEISQIEWIKNQSGHLEINNNELIYIATYSDPNIEHKVNDYLKWIKRELDDCREYISKHSGKWSNLRFPYQIISNTDQIGYESGDFQLTMDQERILDLLTGENLYSDTCVFVRELLQNSIDAVLWRGNNDPYFDAKKDGKITITTWHDETGQGWFKIEDNGTGMDEKIIKNYFLKAGCSYYASDDFENERNTYSLDKTYKPISRFGIGILSCFMNCKKNILEVSTKRYTHDRGTENSAIRLCVTGLKGYFTLAKESEQEECDWQKMPSQNGEDAEYFRTEVGTTICVGMNFFRLGNYHSIKDVVDKYVQFPDMKVEYRGYEGTESYPTRDDFLLAVTKLKEKHNNVCPIVCNHPIPYNEFEKLKQHYPEFEWNSVPEIALSYYPLDNYTSGDNLFGMTVKMGINLNNQRGLYCYEDKYYNLDMSCHIEINNYMMEFRFRVNIPKELEEKTYDLSKNDITRYIKDYHITIPYNSLYNLLSESEKPVFLYAVQNNTAGKNGVIAYNGVFADNTNRGFLFDINPYKALLLLRNGYAPEVNVARDSITRLPFAATVELCIIDEIIGRISYSDDFIFSKYYSNYQYYTEQELRKQLETHPEWESWINISERIQKIKHYLYIENFFVRYFPPTLLENLRLAVFKKDFDLGYENHTLLLLPKTENSIDTSLFPVQMFFTFPTKSVVFGRVNEFGLNTYSPKHSFSQWLIKKQELLKNELPEVYNKILEIMIELKSKTDVMNYLNARIKQLKNYKNNLFEITDELELTEKDFD